MLHQALVLAGLLGAQGSGRTSKNQPSCEQLSKSSLMYHIRNIHITECCATKAAMHSPSSSPPQPRPTPPNPQMQTPGAGPHLLAGLAKQQRHVQQPIIDQGIWAHLQETEAGPQEGRVGSSGLSKGAWQHPGGSRLCSSSSTALQKCFSCGVHWMHAAAGWDSHHLARSGCCPTTAQLYALDYSPHVPLITCNLPAPRQPTAHSGLTFTARPIWRALPAASSSSPPRMLTTHSWWLTDTSDPAEAAGSSSGCLSRV